MRIAWGSIYRKKDKRKKLFDQHKKLFQAIRQHDPKKAAEEALAHLSFAEQNFREGLKVEE
jgi:DNA-binding FadR family transcriptional regulator